jgi:hypothetical protein
MKTSSILGILVLFASQAAVAGDCYHYMPEKVSIKGRISMETLPGADKKSETYFFLNPAAPLCFTPAADDAMDKPVAGLSKIQLSFREEATAMAQTLQSNIDSEIQCSGYFFSWHTDRHHTPVLMYTKECNPVAPATAAVN